MRDMAAFGAKTMSWVRMVSNRYRGVCITTDIPGTECMGTMDTAKAMDTPKTLVPGSMKKARSYQKEETILHPILIKENHLLTIKGTRRENLGKA